MTVGVTMETRLSQVVVPEVRKTREAMECAAKGKSLNNGGLCLTLLHS